MKTILNYFSGIKLEMKKVSWSNKQELIGSTIVVLVFAIILGLFLWFLDDVLLSPVAGWIYSNKGF